VKLLRRRRDEKRVDERLSIDPGPSVVAGPAVVTAAATDAEQETPNTVANSPGPVMDNALAIPRRQWWGIVRRGVKRFGEHQMSLLAAGVAFYGFLSMVPALIATVLVYGLVTDADEVTKQVESLSGVMPASARDLLKEQILGLVTSSHSGLGIGVFISLSVALWSASGGTGNLITAINVAYGELDSRNFLRKRALALGLTVGAIIFFLVLITLVGVFPVVSNVLDLNGPAKVGLEIVRWLLLLGALMLSLGVMYRLAPDHKDRRFRWVSPGAEVAIVLWLVAALGFSLYVDNFGSYGKTYGSLAGIVVLLMFFWISVSVVLLGAEINAESERLAAATADHPEDTDVKVDPGHDLRRRHPS
jgi:membrane protein